MEDWRRNARRGRTAALNFIVSLMHDVSSFEYSAALPSAVLWGVPTRHDIAARQPLRWKLTCATMDSASRFKLTRLFWIGLVLLILGTGPLLAIALAAELGLLSSQEIRRRDKA